MTTFVDEALVEKDIVFKSIQETVDRVSAVSGHVVLLYDLPWSPQIK